MIERLRRHFREDNAAPRDDDPLRELRLRAVLGDPFLRRRMRGMLDASEDLVAETVGAELGLPPTAPGLRIFAAGVTGLLMAMMDRAAHDHAHYGPVGISDAGLEILSAAFEALRTQGRTAPSGKSARRGP